MKILAFSDLNRDASKAEAIMNECRGAEVAPAPHLELRPRHNALGEKRNDRTQAGPQH
jgi:hypothetical protein